MNSFNIDDELALLEGIRAGLGEKWIFAQDWIKIHAHDDSIDITIRPPATKPLFRWRELIMSEIPGDDGLQRLGKLVGYEMAAYLNKYRSLIEPSAFPD